MRKLLLTMSLILSIVLWSYGQSRTVTGTVTDDKNELLPGAKVMVKGTTIATSTNNKGSYNINITDENAILVFSFIGFDNVELKVGKQNIHNVQLLPQSTTLNDLVVTGYQTQKKADLTGAVSVVDVKELKKMPNNNPIQALQGRVPGMVVYTDGSPSGSNVGILIRGISSINGTNPLYVIDGVATTAGMHELNANDIESIQVLKDASSASIYGSRAASGVIIITTKKAKKGELQINANARRGYSFYQSKLKVLDAEGYGKAAWQASANDAFANGGSPLNSYLSYQFDWKQNSDGSFVLNKINIPEYIDPAKTMKSANTNWFKEISQTGISQNYDLSVANGTDKGSSVFSLDYTDNQGIVKTTDFTRISARMNADYKLIDNKLLIGENFTASTTKEIQGNTLNDALQALPIIPVHTVDGIGWGGPYGGMNDRQNPVRLLEDNKQNHYNYLRLFGNAFADLEVIKDLHLRSSLGIDYGNFTSRNIRLPYVSGYLNNPISQVNMTNWSTTKLTWTNTLNYKKTIGKHNIDVLGGFEAYKENNLDFSASRQGFASTDLNYMYLNAGTGLKDNGGGASEYRLLSYFGKANYVYNEKYLASATLRYDGSSRFGTNNQFGLFPAFSLGWRINNEDFMKDKFNFVSDLKLRYGYGKNGNQDNIPATASKTLYVTNYNGTSYNLSGSGSGNLPSGYQIIQRSNDDVKWETTTQSNLGLDFGFLDQKIFGSVDIFVKKTSDMLITPSYIAVIGEGGDRTVNGASLENRGFELLIGYKGKIASKVDFEITGNIATYRNKFTSLPEEVVNSYGGNGLGDNILGHSVGSGYGYVTDGLFTTRDQVLTSAEQLGKGLGRIRYKDLNGDGLINEKDQAWIFNPTPDYTYGMNFNFSYKGFDLTLFFQGVGNQQINVRDIKSATDFWSVSETGSNKGARLLEAWSTSNPNSTIPALTLTDRNTESRFSTYYIENGKYLKLRNLQIAYNLPKKLSSKIKASNLNVFVSGQNLFTVKSKNFSGIDPEIPSYGYPIPTIITTGIKVAF